MMPDIAMCEGTGCPRKESCHRFTATPSEYRQSYFETPPVKEDGRCEMCWGDAAQDIYDSLSDIVNGFRNT
jgi:hypothetical protein